MNTTTRATIAERESLMIHLEASIAMAQERIEASVQSASASFLKVVKNGHERHHHNVGVVNLPRKDLHIRQ